MFDKFDRLNKLLAELLEAVRQGDIAEAQRIVAELDPPAPKPERKQTDDELLIEMAQKYNWEKNKSKE